MFGRPQVHQCSQRRTRSCKGAVVTDSVIQTVIKKTDHCHDGDNNTVKATQLKEELKTKAATTRGTPGQLVSDSAVTTTADVRAALGDVDVLKRTLRRQRAKNNPKNPTSVSDLIIDDTWTTTGGEDPKPFLFYDNGSDARNRMLVFGAPIALEHLARSDIWMKPLTQLRVSSRSSTSSAQHWTQDPSVVSMHYSLTSPSTPTRSCSEPSWSVVMSWVSSLTQPL